ncbi:beta-N-acetylhexosaminidase [Paenibacillus sp. M1]|uniref:Beta-N-acetylhexosaminidase n=1 Tax=Paenibacillus haidiansis TaxID=1574488 RepID=A0ABU7VVV0_9BACL
MARRWRKLFGAALILALVTAGCGGNNAASPNQTGGNSAPNSADQPQGNDGTAGENVSPEPDPAPSDPARDQLEMLTTAEKIGQLVLVGMEGTVPDEHTRELIETYRVGGFIFYKDNIKDSAQALALFNKLKQDNESNPVPLFLSVDEEGGRVSRMPEEFKDMPAAAKIGGTGKPEAAEAAYKIIGEQLSRFGLNLDFAPVLDVNSNPDNPVIGDRAFGETPELVSEMGTAAMNGLSAYGVIPVVKHFPGHGDTSVDSHLGLPVVNHDLDRLRKLELIPFQAAIDNNAEVIMIAHLLLPKLDPDNPASFSEAVIHDLLRGELGFEGIVISDDMTMGAIAENYDIEEAAVNFILAGGNIVLVGHDYNQELAVIKAITEAVERGTISKEVLDERVYDVLKLKEKYVLSGEPAPGPDAKAINASIEDFDKQYGIR